MVPSHWQQLRILLPIPGADRPPCGGTCCFEAQTTEKDDCGKEQSKWPSFEGKFKNCQKEYKEKVTNIKPAPRNLGQVLCSLKRSKYKEKVKNVIKSSQERSVRQIHCLMGKLCILT